MEASFFLSLREGLEAFLIVGILLAILDKLKLQYAKKYVWLGLVFGLITSAIVSFIFIVIIDGFESEDLKYITTLGILMFAILMLSYMIFWVHKSSISNDLQQKIELSANQKFAVFSIIFFAVLREGFELILLILAISSNLQTSNLNTTIWTVLGLVTSAMLIYTMFASSKKLSIKQIFKYSTYSIIIITAGLVSLLIRGLQAKDYIVTFIDPIYDTSFLVTNSSSTGQILGALIGYDATPSLLQVVVFVGYILAALLFTRKKNV